MTQHVLFIVTNAAVIGPKVARPSSSLQRSPILSRCWMTPASRLNSPRPPTDGPYGAFDDNDPAKKAFFESKAFRRLNRSRKLSEVDAADYDAILGHIPIK